MKNRGSPNYLKQARMNALEPTIHGVISSPDPGHHASVQKYDRAPEANRFTLGAQQKQQASARPMNQSQNLIASPTDRVKPIAINFSQRGSEDDANLQETDEANLTLSSANFESPDDKQATMKPNKLT
jgi:hypothetical protein